MADAVPQGVDPSVPAPARIYDYLLAGENNFEADRAAAEQIMKAVPEIRDAAWSNRGFHQRATKWIAEQGIRQFIDIGSGLPTVGNTHEIVQQVWPEARVAYVDNDPLVRAHSWPVTGRPASCWVTCASRTGSWAIPRCAGSSISPSRRGC
jgi:S-adenosyl methyltransferase